MSNFSEQLKLALHAAELTQAELSSLTDFTQSSISRYLKGEITPPMEAFGTLLDALPVTLHYDLIVARLTDELPLKYRETITILSQGATAVREDAIPYRPLHMAEDLRRAVEYLANEAIQQPAVRELLVALARSLGLPK